MTLHERTLPLRRGLAGLRRRARSLVVVLGVSRTLLFAGAALATLFLMDYLLRLPLSVRAIFLLLLLLGTAVVLVRRLLRPLLARLGDEALAGHVEAAHPDLLDRLRSSLAFAHAEEDPENEDSRELMAVVVDETVRRAQAIRFAEVARSGPTLRWATAAGALAAALLLAAGSQPVLASTFVQRALFLRDVSWPRRTTLTVVDMEPGVPRRVTLGRETTLQIRADGSLPDRVRFTFWEQERGRTAADALELTPAAEDPSLFAFSLKIHTSYEFTISGGDDDRELLYRIDALTPPAILSLEMEATYPEYLGLAPATLRGGGQRLPQGTQVRLRVRTNMDLQRATITVGADEPRPLEALEPRLYGTDLVATRNVRYSLRLVGANGEENDPGVDSYLLQVVHDQAPSARILTPGAHTERLPGGVALVAFRAQDDHRVASATLRYRINEETERVIALGEAGGDAVRILEPPAQPPDDRRAVAVFDFARLRRADGALVAKGDRITYDFEAQDSSGRTRRTRTPHRIELVSEEDITQILQGRQRDLKDSVRHADLRAHEAVEKRDLAREARADPQEFHRWNHLAQAAQARVIDYLLTVSDKVRGVINLYVFNRLDDRSAADQILPFFERHLLEPVDESSVPFRAELYRSLWTAITERRIRAGDAHRKLIEMAELADRLAGEHGPRAYRALGRIATASTEAERDAALEEARAEQRTVLEGLDRLLRLMREWESYEGVVRWFKALRDREKSIVEELGSAK